MSIQNKLACLFAHRNRSLLVQWPVSGDCCPTLLQTTCIQYVFPHQPLLVRALTQACLAALQYCHAKGVYHRDLKPENLLINDNYDLKVADFGLAAVTEDANGIVSVLKTKCGTKGYMAPEVLERNAGYHGGPADVWSSAVILFIMVAGFPPLAVAQRGDWWFDRIRNRQWSHFWAAHERSATFTDAFKSLIQSMFNANPAERATVDEILKSDWLNGDSIEPATVQAEMARRWAVVESKKSAERSKAAESSTGDLDLLGGGITRGADGPTAAPLPALPMGGLSSALTSSFYAPGAAGDIADALVHAFSSSGASQVQANKADGDVHVQAVVNGMGVVATVFEDGAAHLIDFSPVGVSADGHVLSDDDEGEFQGTEMDFRGVVAAVQASMTGAAVASGVGVIPAAPEGAAAAGGDDSFSELM